ncbi:MAG: aldehyde dehydrogenase family protein [Planctomycetota bacterium]
MTTEFSNYIDGEWVAAQDGETFEHQNPARLSDVTGRFPLSKAQDVDKAITAAQQAFHGWACTSPRERVNILERALENMEDRKEDIARVLSRENGKTVSEAEGEIDYAIADMQFQLGEGLRLSGETVPVTIPNVHAYSVREPVGLVGIITPWNFPFNVPTSKCVPALVAGCSVVFKPARLTPRTAIEFVKLFADAGVPPGVLNLVIGTGSEAGDALVCDERIDAISFTGSTRVGKMINRKAAEKLTRTQLEMGGKNAVVILEDADLQRAAEDTVAAAFGTAGQKCTATSRAIVTEDVADEIVELLLQEAQDLTVGDGLEEDVDMGPVTGTRQMDKIMEYIEIGKQEDAELVLGGEKLTGGDYEDGCFIAPTIFDHVSPDMTIAQEEIFGPVLCIERVADFDEAVEVNNDVRYGLSASIYTEDLDKAHTFLHRAEVGVGHVNLMTALNEPQLSFGGMKESGFGLPEAGPESTEFYTEQKVSYVKYQ